MESERYGCLSMLVSFLLAIGYWYKFFLWSSWRTSRSKKPSLSMVPSLMESKVNIAKLSKAYQEMDKAFQTVLITREETEPEKE